MEKAKMKLVRFGGEDVIATSGVMQITIKNFWNEVKGDFEVKLLNNGTTYKSLNDFTTAWYETYQMTQYPPNFEEQNVTLESLYQADAQDHTPQYTLLIDPKPFQGEQTFTYDTVKKYFRKGQ